MNNLYNATHQKAADFTDMKIQSVLMQGDDDIRRNFLNQSAMYLGMDLADSHVASIVAGEN